MLRFSILILRPLLYRDNFSPGQKSHSLTPATLDQPTFRTLPHKAQRTIYTRNKTWLGQESNPVVTLFRWQGIPLSGLTFLHINTFFQENPSDWDIHIDNLLRKASSLLYILRVCKYFGYPKEQLTKLFDLLIMFLFFYGIEIWGAAYQGKYLDRIDKFFKRAFRFGYTNNLYAIAEDVRNRDCKLWNTITETPSHPLYQLLPPKKQRFLRNRGHDFILAAVKTERFKRSFINRFLFNFI